MPRSLSVVICRSTARWTFSRLGLRIENGQLRCGGVDALSAIDQLVQYQLVPDTLKFPKLTTPSKPCQLQVRVHITEVVGQEDWYSKQKVICPATLPELYKPKATQAVLVRL